MAKTKLSKNLLPALLSVILLILLFFLYQMFIFDKFYPLTFIGNINVSFLNYTDGVRAISANVEKRAQNKLLFTLDSQNFTIDLATSSATIDYAEVESELIKSHPANLWERVGKQLENLIFYKKIVPKINLSLENVLEAISSSVNKKAQDAKVIFDETPTPAGTPSARIQIQAGLNGIELDQEGLKKQIARFLLTGQYTNELPIKILEPKVTTSHVSRAKQALEEILREPVKLNFKGNLWVLDTKQLLTLLDLTSGGDLLLDKDKTYTYIGKIAQTINSDVQEGLFEFHPQTRRVTAFKTSKQGQQLDEDRTYQLISQAVSGQASHTITLPVTIINPKIPTSDANSLGIKELLARGISHFAGSIPNRIYNIQLTAQKINGILVPPGEIFSFNQAVGDITAATGFKQAYVIKEGRTVLDDGGGVCQDSTTLFRAVLNAGLPVVQRTAHAYRVGYYEQGFPPGLDATVFYPSVDFQFKNDTQNHILIQAYTAGTTLYVDLYGTSDGRNVVLSKPVVTDRVPAPEPLYQDDPTLPKGTTKQVDWAAQGAKVKFTRTVYRNGEEIIKETWNSFYKSWQAIYLVGTQ
ncbi:VanW family protein [Candidatus Daviesbacteria bacterium]|nr:VanW family protein [Candidatus Daviesbacteria bacterium]